MAWLFSQVCHPNVNLRGLFVKRHVIIAAPAAMRYKF